MAEYIERSAALDKLDEALVRSIESGGSHEVSGLVTAKCQIAAVPAADVVEVRHGEWVVKDLNNPLYESKKAPHCSVCGEMSFIRWDYCPDCGAKMNGERKEK